MSPSGHSVPINQNENEVIMTALAEKTNNSTAQELCIDLPGESVQCWRSSDKLKVILRKHRDVIFDLHLGNSKTYTVHATDSDFYSARDKKIVHAKRREMVSFRDGERMHLWVTRAFKGALVLKCEDQTILKIMPNEFDSHQYDDAPKTKMAPIIVALGKPSHRTTKIQGPANKPAEIRTPAPAAAPVDEECAIVCVVDGTIKGMPAEVAGFFAEGGGDSGLADIDPYKIATRNWIWGQLSGVGAYVGDNWEWLRASLDSRTHQGFRLVKAQVHLVQGKVRFYFSGFSKYNAVFGRGGFGPGHDRVMTIFAGAGKASSSLSAAVKGIAGTFKGNALISFIFGAATSIAEWKDDVKKDGYDLAASLLMGTLKTLVVTFATSIIVAIITFVLMFFFGAALPVIAVGALVVSVGAFGGYVVEAVDKKLGQLASHDKNNSDGLSSVIAPYLRNAGQSIRYSWEILMKLFPNDYPEAIF
jgi:hypothetical protein